MKVKRIIANIRTEDPTLADRFYRDILGLELAMDHGWIRTYASPSHMTVQLSVAQEGGSGTDVPDLSVEVDDLEEALQRWVESLREGARAELMSIETSASVGLMIR